MLEVVIIITTVANIYCAHLAHNILVQGDCRFSHSINEAKVTQRDAVTSLPSHREYRQDQPNKVLLKSKLCVLNQNSTPPSTAICY